jgi:hypothetical protein
MEASPEKESCERTILVTHVRHATPYEGDALPFPQPDRGARKFNLLDMDALAAEGLLGPIAFAELAGGFLAGD